MAAPASAIALMGQGGDLLAHLGQGAVGEHGAGRALGDAVFVQKLARQIQPAARRVLGQIAQDVGELQGAAQGVGHAVGLVLGRAEYARRNPAHGAGDPVAVEVQFFQRRRVDVGFRVHFHAGDDGDEIGAAQIVSLRPRSASARDSGRRGAPFVKRVDLAPPSVQRRQLGFGRVGAVGDVVDLAAKGVDREHGLAPRLGQKAHRPIERGLGRRDLGVDRRLGGMRRAGCAVALTRALRAASR